MAVLILRVHPEKNIGHQQKLGKPFNQALTFHRYLF